MASAEDVSPTRIPSSDDGLGTRHDVTNGHIVTPVSLKHQSPRPNGSSSDPGVLSPQSLEVPRTRSTGFKSQASPSISSHTRRASEGNWMTNNEEVDADENGGSTPPARRSVQFARQDVEPADANPNQPPALRTRNSRLYAKFKALATSPTFIQTRTSGGPSIEPRPHESQAPETSKTLGGAGDERHFPMTLEEDDAEADADAEESAPEAPGLPSRRKRKKSRRVNSNGIETAPSSPRSPLRPGFFSTHSAVSAEKPKYFLPRRATTNDSATQGREGVSEDEGRQRLSNASPWRRKSTWLPSTLQSSHPQDESPNETKRPKSFRHLTGLLNTTEDPDGQGSSRRHKTERGTSMSGSRLRNIANTIRLLGQGKKKERTIDYEKSAELLAELQAGSPAALMIASMFQRDEHGSKRIPVLLEQLRLRITDSYDEKDKEHDTTAPGDRHTVFRIELEYGYGINRMKWVVGRSLGDFAKMHSRYKFHFGAQKYLQLKAQDGEAMPSFPMKAFPYLRSYRGLEDEEGADNDVEGDATDVERPGINKRRQKSSYNFGRRKSSVGLQESGAISGTGAVISNASGTYESPVSRPNTYKERQRKILEVYLQKMTKFMLFRPESNRLCKFLELSALGIRLASESTYHGKEGFLMIQSSKGFDFRKKLTPANLKGRHTPKWFLVRNSYVVCVNSPEEMHIYDVFLFDPEFEIQSQTPRLRDQKPRELAKTAKASASHPQHHRLRIQNSERKIKLLARSERQLHQFEESIKATKQDSPWAKKHRFDSFAPVRYRCFAQWLVDGRDHMWVVSRAISQAKDVIYIHDWWLSPELYMRRPAAIGQQWRLDRLLKRKAEEGVKVFVIVYRNIESAIPIDSEYTKFSLLDLHPNVFVQRSPNQFRQNTFFWAHHEKLCIVDHTLAFVGGVDLCFGRWDTPQHTVVDDKSTGFSVNDYPKDADHCQLWPGKDYSNPRVLDFYALNNPFEDMYDRKQVARMPWHDISMQVVGQPARDLTRHFVQRWNYILRQRKPTRATPFLLPPPDFVPADLEALGLDGTCEVQILRSCGPWSIGTPDKTEHSIMNAYVKLIEQSEHFIYIENQFFISSCETEITTIQNLIGDALVERIIRAAKQEENWRAVIIIPLVPGFQNTVDSEGGTSVRLIMQYQYRSICRGDSSIFGRLKAQGIEPEDYIQFYSLRTWGKIGPKKHLVTEQLYVHAKCMIVDDRVAIIGSANINERSMLGNRDSECAAIVRDTDMIWSQMNGQSYQVGRFPHTLRMRLMREHLGLDIDHIMEENFKAAENEEGSNDRSRESSQHREHRQTSTPLSAEDDLADPGKELRDDLLDRSENMYSFNHDVDWEQANNPNLKSTRKRTEDSRVTNNAAHRREVQGEGADNMIEIHNAGYSEGRGTILVGSNKEVLLSDIASEGRDTIKNPRKPSHHSSMIQPEELDELPPPPRPDLLRIDTAQLGLPMTSQLPPLPETDDSDIGGPNIQRTSSKATSDWHHPLFTELRRPLVDKDCMKDPVNDTFFFDTWQAIAENNSRIYRAVFRCMPDNEVKDWKDYKEYNAYFERFNLMQGMTEPGKHDSRPHTGSLSKSGPPGAASTATKAPLSAIGEAPFEVEKKSEDIKEKFMNIVTNNTEDQEASEKQKLHDWATEANRAQIERQERRLSQDGDGSPLDEKAGVQTMDTVPENHTLATNTTDQIDGTTIKSSNPSEMHEKARFVGYSEALNMNAQPSQKRRRRATTRSSRREFQASDDIPSPAECEEILNLVQGHLVAFPYDW